MVETDSKTRREDKHRKTKRKHRSSEENGRDSDAGVGSSQERRKPDEEEVQERGNKSKKIKSGGFWSNLDLILSLQNKELEIERKVELALEFLNSRRNDKGSNEIDGGSEMVSDLRLIKFLNDWVQSLLVSPAKKIRVRGRNGDVEASLDFRCWAVFKFCLEESLRLRIPLTFSPNLLRALSCIGKDALTILDNKNAFLTGHGYELYSLLPECFSLMFSSPGRVFNANLDLWVNIVSTVIDLVHKIYVINVFENSRAHLLLRLACLILEPFSTFLRVHPSPKNLFPVFIDRLLEPLLSLLVTLSTQIDGSSSSWIVNLLKMVEDILSNGLYHPAHVDGFLTTHSTEKYIGLDDGKATDTKTAIKSYHRHFFQKLKKIMADKKISTLGAVGDLFRLFVIRLKKQKGVHVLSEITTATLETKGSGIREMSKVAAATANEVSGGYHSLNRLDIETGKALFDLFVQYMEPLVLDIKKYSKTNMERSMLSDAHCTLKSANKILSGFMDEKVYDRTEDTSEGARLNILKEFYQILFSFSAKLQLIWLSALKTGDRRSMELLPLVMKEIIIAVGYFLEIEYEAVGSDLVSLWHMIFSYSAVDLAVSGTADRCLLASEISYLGCRLITIYSELRQVNNPIFALCKAVRLFAFLENDGIEQSKFVFCRPSLSVETCVQSVTMLLCVQELRGTICDAIESIPEGQASGCIKQLIIDISDTLEWMKVKCLREEENGLKPRSQKCRGMENVNLQAELLGKALSEVYAIILDHLAVTTGNSILVGNSIKDLMETVGPSFSTLVGKHPDSISELLFSVTGRKISFHDPRECRNDVSIVRSIASWVSLFFFRVYVSCRGLYRQSISLMPPEPARKASKAIGDLSSSNCGQEWERSTDWKDEGYFSWVIKPSNSLLAVLQSVSEICHQESVTGYAPLVYVMHVMALQRLVDLNRLIKAFEFLREEAIKLVEMNSMDDASLPVDNKESKKLKRTLSVLRQEAADITSFLIGYRQLIVKKVEVISTGYCASSEGEEKRSAHEDDAWDLCVSALNEKSLPIAVWWILCQNTDIWCPHATKKDLKKFLFLLFHIFLSCARNSYKDVRNHDNDEPDKMKKVTLHHISLEVLSDTIFYEQTFLCRHLTSRFCDALEKSVLSLFGDSLSRDVDLSSSCDWLEILSELEKTSGVILKKAHVAGAELSTLRSASVPFDSPTSEYSKELTACLRLLNLLRWIPKAYPDLKSFRVYVSYILNLEKLTVFSLLDSKSELPVVKQYELFQLFVCCRKTLKHLVMASCEVKIDVRQSSVVPIFSENLCSVLWLLKSVNALVQHLPAFAKQHATEVKYMMFSLMDHTSFVYLTFTKDQFGVAVDSLVHDEKSPDSESLSEKDNLNEADADLELSTHLQALKTMEHLAETLKEHSQSLLIWLKKVIPKEKLNPGFSPVDLNKLSSTISCIQGFLWGLSSVLKNRFEQCTEETKLLRGWFARNTKLNLCMTKFEELINFCFHALVVESRQETNHLNNERLLSEPDSVSDSLVLQASYRSPLKFSGGVVESSSRCEEVNGTTKVDAVLSDPDVKSLGNTVVDDSNKQKKRFKPNYADCAINVLNEVDSFERQRLKKPLLRSLLIGEHPEVAFCVRQLFTASSSLLSLKLQIYCSNFSSNSMPISIGTSQFLLSEFVDMVEEPHPFSFVWLDGVLKYLEVLGNYISLTNPTSSRDVYARLINIHLRAIGRCISMQGKRATLASHETESSTKTLTRQTRASKTSHRHGQYSLDEFTARLRMSFKVFIRKPLELHLLTAVQALERALVGVHEECNMVYDINTGGPCGGKVSSVVAAGVDCFDLVLESVSGRKRLNVVKRHIQSLIGALFNIILHLQDQVIFYENSSWNCNNISPDSGSVILMCVEILTKVAGKPVLFQMDPCHVGQSLHIPAALFRDFHQLKPSQSLSSLPLGSANKDLSHVASTHSCIVDQQFSVDLFAACCRLLSTVLRHHKSESERCISILEESVSVLLHCLETVNTDLNGKKDCYAWEVVEGIKCASFLRRIYEEIRQQKEVLGRYCSHFLSTYIWVYSGYGPFKTGIRREIDEALRPGVYALIDSCSPDDLQQLHTVLGEGPCRSTLATLQRDYKQNFQYEGKV